MNATDHNSRIGRISRSPGRILTVLSASAVMAAVLLSAAWTAADERRGGETQVFGVTGRGRKFVYVFDRSLSMQGAPLAAAKRELIASLGRLEDGQQFQIIFYNEKPRMMPARNLLF